MKKNKILSIILVFIMLATYIAPDFSHAVFAAEDLAYASKEESLEKEEPIQKDLENLNSNQNEDNQINYDKENPENIQNFIEENLSISEKNEIQEVEEDTNSEVKKDDEQSKDGNKDLKNTVIPTINKGLSEMKGQHIHDSATNLYLNGKSGNDAEGRGYSPDKPLKTFGKAKEIATNNQNIKKIIVTGTTELKDTEKEKISLKGTQAEILRGKGFKNYLFEVKENNTASLKNIIIDGKFQSNTERALIDVKNKATLNIESGTILKNNKIKKQSEKDTKGGAIHAVGATINMTGGTIKQNAAVYGGGIYLKDSILNFSGGKILKNTAHRIGHKIVDSEKNNKEYHAAGGGIIADEGATINLSKEAKILGNRSEEIGGGISVGTHAWPDRNNLLIMKGGSIKGNISAGTGGGIYIQAGFKSGGTNKAIINRGEIKNNKVKGESSSNFLFGGGGIYVNGLKYPQPPKRSSFENGKLKLKNAIIVNNKAGFAGAGYAACPISKTKIYVTDGVAIYKNNTTSVTGFQKIDKHSSRGKDLYIKSCTGVSEIGYDYKNHAGIPEYKLSKRMLGGVLNKWRKEDDSFLPLDKYEAKLKDGNELALHTDKTGNDLTESLGQVIISGNSAPVNGGGIGSNGDVTFGKEDEILTKVEVQKKWDIKGKSLPESIEVQLIAKLKNKEYVIETRELTADEGWKTTFEELPTEFNGEPANYTVKELEVPGYTTKIDGNAEDGFIITNSPETDIPKTTKIVGTKTWDDNKNQDGKRPESITIRLLANGKEVDSKKVTAKNNWSWSFTGLDKYDDAGKLINYTITEDTVEDYTSTVKGFDVTNSYTPGKTQVNVRKVWNDSNNQDGKRPEKIKVKLLADGKETGKELVLTEANNWAGSFTGLEAYKLGEKIDYTIEEVEVTGYKTTITGNEKIGYTITNSQTPETTSVHGAKIWKDCNDQDGKRPESITIRLFADGKEVDLKEVTAEDNWEWSFTGLDKYADGELINYTISEDPVEGYTSEVKGFDVVNTHGPGEKEVPGEGEDEDNENPKSGDPGLGQYLLTLSLSLVGIGVLLNKKKNSLNNK